jgi:hypothetical protein
VNFVVGDTDKNGSVFTEKFTQQGKARIHHAQPLVVAAQIFDFLAYDRTQPLSHFRAVDVVVVNPALVSGVVGRVDIDALHLSGIVGEQGLQGLQIVTFNQKVPGIGIPGGKLIVAVKKAIGYLSVVVENRFLSNPVQRRHY